MQRLLVTIASVVLVAAACGGDTSEAGAVLDGYQEARSSGDIEALMTLYAEDAVVENHPAADVSTVVGAAQIRDVEWNAIGVQGSTGGIEFTDREVSGNTVTFKDRFRNAEGECYSSGGHQITVEDGKITRFVWGNEEAPNLCD